MAIEYRRDIDGIRAVAVMVVVLFHAEFPGFSGGFVGVDVFFVLSGYLITSLIMRDVVQGRFSFVRFFERRARRLFPALYAVMGGTTAMALILFTPSALRNYARSLVAAALYVSNILFWRTSGYFDAPSESRPLLHTWSLSVEEQFYLITPLLLVLLYRFAKSWMGLLLVIIALVSLAFSAWGVVNMPTSTFYLLPSRFWELLSGALLALGLVPAVRSPRARELIAGVGLALIVVPCVLYDDLVRFPGFAALPPTLGTIALVHTGSSTRVGQLLSTRPLVAVGLISYSLYLWHWPVLVYARYALLRDLRGLESLLAIAASFLLAFLSYRYVEQPFRRPGSAPTEWRKPLAGTVAGAVACAVAAAAILALDGLPSRFEHAETPIEGSSISECRPSPGKACKLTDGGDRRVLLWGDSLSGHYQSGLLDRASDVDATYYLYSSSECMPALGYEYWNRPKCARSNDQVLDVIDELGIETVVLAARWELPWKRRDWDAFGKLQHTLDVLEESGTEVFVIGQTPVLPAHPTDLFLRSDIAVNAPAHIEPVNADRVNETLRRWLPPSTGWIDPIESLCSSKGCPYRSDGSFLYSDSVHFSRAGSRQALHVLPYVTAED